MFSYLRRKQNKGLWVSLFMLCLVAAAWLLPGLSASAASRGAQLPMEGTRVSPYENGYFVSINTGANDGQSVEGIRIRYMARDINAHDYCMINPETDLNKTVDVLSDGRDKAPKGLMRDSTNLFLIQPAHPVLYFDRVEVILKGSGQWTCNGASIIRIDHVSDVDLSHVNEGNVFAKFSGMVMYRMKTSETSDGYQNLTITHSYSEVRELPFVRVEEPYETGGGGSLAIRMDIADVYKAGLEGLQSFSQKDSTLENYKDIGLNAIIRYKDTGGSARTIKYPVISSIVNYAVSKGVAKNALLAGLVEQGKTAVFAVQLPDYASFIDCTWDFTNATIQNDNFNLIGMSVYDTEKVPITVTVQDGFLSYEFDGNPDYYYRAGFLSGSQIIPGQRVTYNKDREILPFEEDSYLLPKDNRSLYLVELRTENIPSAAATGEAYVTINYQQQNDKMAAAKELFLPDIIGDYYGYDPAQWMADNGAHVGELEEFEYYYHTSQGATLRFYIDLNDVKQFKSLEVRMGSATDTWQITAVTIYSVSSFGERSVIWGDQTTLGVARNGFYSNRDYTRSRTGTINTLAMSAESAFIQNGNTVTIPFDSSEIINEDENEVYNRKKEGQSYDEICKDYGFTKTRGNYTVCVKVANDTLTDFDMGDCGSENYFYFQLLFKDGEKSPIVLANQQIAGDAFRAGETATFTIRTNRDYGDVEAVRIIPDASAAKSEIFDKLKIDNIQVIQESNAGISTTWCFENIGWIDINYHDEGEQKVGQTIAELARDFDRTDRTYSAKLEFALTTNANINNEDQFVGNVKAVISYLDQNDRPQTMPIDVTQYIYNYNDNLKMNKDETTQEIVSDPEQMFRFGKTDRFEVSFPNIKILQSMKLDVRATKDNTAWTIGGLTASVVTSGGVVRLNENGEYERSSIKINEITNRTNLPHPITNLSPTARQPYSISFVDNKINLNGGSIEISSRTPISAADRMNVYVTMSEGAESTLNYPLQALIEYSTVNGKHLESLATLMPSADGRSAYVSGMSASLMNTVTAVRIFAIGKGDQKALVDSVVIEQYRQDSYGLYKQVVCEYHVSMGGQNAALTGGVTGSPGSRTIGNNTEKVYFGVQKTEEVIRLLPNEKDMVARILYQSTCAPYGDTFASEEVSLTSQMITELATGKVVSLEFQNSLVGRIVGIELRTIGGLNIAVDAVYADLFETTQGITQLKSTVSMTGSKTVSAVPSTWTVAEDYGPVVPMEIAFTTSVAQGTTSGSNNPVRLTVGYKDEEGNHMVRIYEDVRQAMSVTSDFYAGQTQTVRLLIPDAVSIEGFVLEPYDADPQKIASWKLDKLDIAYMKDGAFVYTDTRLMDKFIFENEPVTIGTESVAVIADIVVRDNGGLISERIGNQNASYGLSAGGTLQITVANSGGIASAYKITTDQVTADRAKIASQTNMLTRSGNDTYVFTAPSSETAAYYLITIESTVSDDAKIEIFVQVAAKPAAPETQPTQPTQPVVPETQPTEPETQPTQPETEPTEPETQPAESESSAETVADETEEAP